MPGTTPSVAISVSNASGVLNLGKAAASSFNATQFGVLSGQLNVVGGLSAAWIVTGILQVGANGSGKPIELEVFDHLGSLIGWVGDDTSNSGFVGAWLKQARIGESGPSNAPLVADTSNDDTSGFVKGIEVKDNGSSAQAYLYYWALTLIGGGTSTPAVQLNASGSTSTPFGELKLNDTGGTGTIAI